MSRGGQGRRCFTSGDSEAFGTVPKPVPAEEIG